MNIPDMSMLCTAVNQECVHGMMLAFLSCPMLYTWNVTITHEVYSCQSKVCTWNVTITHEVYSCQSKVSTWNVTITHEVYSCQSKVCTWNAVDIPEQSMLRTAVNQSVCMECF